MSTRTKVLSLALIALAGLCTGCPSVYSHISRIDENTYYVTRVKANQSTLFLCTPMGQTADLRCVEIASTSP